jgi:hypothetical protein
MKTAPQNLIRLTALLLIFFVYKALAQNTETVNEFDPGISVAIDLNRRVRLDFFAGRDKSEEIGAGKEKIGAGISFRTKPVFKHFLDSLDTDKQHRLVIRTSYEYWRGSESGKKTLDEHILAVEGTFRWAFRHGVLLSNRHRVEFRWVNADYHLRFRERLLIERRFKLIKREITPFFDAEAFWDQRYKKWNLFRYMGGVQIRLIRPASLDLAFERLHCVTCPDVNTNSFGVRLNIFLWRKK